ncbi:MAG: HAD family hydrolase [Lachnospiraceae bacterium]|nr:HAD family hydrolase [Lachnospiraceae bacterium]MBQ7780518.1 HAD family hydrolase [Lachnospiraceae bacterium]
MKKAVVFDLDGTLTDTIASIKISADKAVGKYGFGPFSEEQYKYFVGDGAATLIERCLEAGGDKEQKYFEGAFKEYQKVFEEYCMYKVEPYAGIRELLAALKERGIRLAVLSNKPHERTKEVICTIFGDECFDEVRGQMDGVPKKPSPEGVFKILEELSLNAEDILYMGDTGTDMQTGKSAGAFTIGALWGFRQKEELIENGADAIIENPLQLIDYL